MPERQTADLDVVVRAQDAAAARSAMKRHSFTHRGELSIGGSNWSTPDGGLIDLIEGVEPWWGDALAAAVDRLDQDGNRVLTLPYLVLMKLRSGRSLDTGDVTRMLGNADEEAFAEILRIAQEHAPDLVEDLHSMAELGRLEHPAE